MSHARRRRLVAVVVLGVLLFIYLSYGFYTTQVANNAIVRVDYTGSSLALEALKGLAVAPRASGADYARTRFGDGWLVKGFCDTRNFILARDLESDVVGSDGCSVLSGQLVDAYTGMVISFKRGSQTSDAVQIDHVVALADAWQKGAQLLTPEERINFANDGLNLLAVDGPTNLDKGSGDAATWLPPNGVFRCRYVARQIAVKKKYRLWATRAEYDSMKRVLQTCPDQVLPFEVAP